MDNLKFIFCHMIKMFPQKHLYYYTKILLHFCFLSCSPLFIKYYISQYYSICIENAAKRRTVRFTSQRVHMQKCSVNYPLIC